MTEITHTLPWDPCQLRDDFPILQSVIHGKYPLVYLDNAATTQRPRQVIQSLVDVYERQYANVHRGVHWLSDQSTDLYESARESVRQFIHAEHLHEVIFTNGTTAGINIVARSWGDTFVTEGDEILVTYLEHHSNLVPWHQLAERVGCRVQAIPIDDDGRLDLTRLDELLTPKVKLLAVTSVSNVVGTVNPIKQLVERAHGVGARVLVDAAQSVPHTATDVLAWQADFVVFSAHKMLGPSGVGVLYGKEELLNAMPPLMGGGSMIRRVYVDSFEPAELPAKFEAGTPPIVPAIGLGAAINYLNRLGLDNVAAYEHQLVSRAHEVLGGVGGVRIHGPSVEQKSAIVSFSLEGIHPHDVAQLLDRRGIAIRAGHHCAMPLHKRLKLPATNRASFYFYNTPDEIEQLAEALDQVKRVFRRT